MPQHLALIGVCWLIFASVAHAGDRRVALLVGHQQGWAGEEYLRHTLSGDLHPLKKALTSVGFQVLLVANQGPDAIRKVFDQLAKKKIDTFLFYYSGHAGPKAFHLGPRKKGVRPFGYDEFRSYFSQKIKSTRRIAVIDACFGSRLVRMFKKSRIRLKGPRRRVKRNLIKVLKPMIGQTQGVQLIVSSQVHAFEDQRRKASIFTHYLLQGIHGKRAADADQDGMITVTEMFRYAGKRFQRETGEEPSFFDYTVKSVTPYGLVPAYNSYLRISDDIAGQIFVSVGSFVWSQAKPKGRTYRLRVIAGKGEVHLRQGGLCFSQSITFPKNQEVQLTKRWESTKCDAKWLHKKGLVLPARSAPPSAKASAWSLSLSPGYTGFLSGFRASHAFSADVGVHWKNMLGLGLQFQRGIVRNLLASEGTALGITQLALRVEAGYPFQLAPIVQLWLGGYGLAGLLWQHASTGDASALVLGGGLQLLLGFRVHRRVSLLVTARAGLHWLAVTQGSGISFQWYGTTGVMFHL